MKVNWGGNIQFVSDPCDEIFNLEGVGFQLQKLGTIQSAHVVIIGTNGRVEHLQCMPWWGRIVSGLYYKHMCIMYPCIHMQG